MAKMLTRVIFVGQTGIPISVAESEAWATRETKSNQC